MEAIKIRFLKKNEKDPGFFLFRHKKAVFNPRDLKKHRKHVNSKPFSSREPQKEQILNGKKKRLLRSL